MFAVAKSTQSQKTPPTIRAGSNHHPLCQFLSSEFFGIGEVLVAIRFQDIRPCDFIWLDDVSTI